MRANERRSREEAGPVKAAIGSVRAGAGRVGVLGVVARGGIAAHGAADRRSASKQCRLVGEEGFEPSRPCGHTDLNRARLPFRPPPGNESVSTTHPDPHRRYDRMREG